VNDLLQDLSNLAVAAGVEKNNCAFFRLFRHWPKAEVCEGADMVWTLTNIRFSVFNSVCSARLEPRAVDRVIDAAIARCRSRRVPMLWTTGPATRPANLGEHLQAHGFVTAGDRPGMASDLGSLNEDIGLPPGLVVERVCDPSLLATWCKVFVAGFGMPRSTEGAWLDLFASIGRQPQTPLHHYIGWSDGLPVATAALLLAAGVAGIYSVSTLPQARRQGFATALTVAALQDARDQGYNVGVLSATEAGARIYRRIGFRECCRISSYVWASSQ
jgi:GNAT superfamily N-acetyltransferase